MGFRWSIKGIGGPIPSGSKILLVGPVGTSLASLTERFIENGVADGERIVYVSLSKSREQFRLDCPSELCLSALSEGVLAYLDFSSGSPSISEISHTVMENMKSTDKPTRLIIDSLGIMALKYGVEQVIKWSMSLKPRIAQLNAVELSILEKGIHPLAFENAESALSECIVEISNIEERGALRTVYRIVVCKGLQSSSSWYRLE